VGRAIFIRCTRKGKRNELSETKRDSTPPPFLADAVRRVGGHGGGRETEKGRGTKKKTEEKKGEKREEKRSLKLLPNSVGEAEGTSGEGRIRFTHDCPPRKHIEHAFFRFIGQPIFAPFVLEHGQRRSPSRGERKDGREGRREGGRARASENSEFRAMAAAGEFINLLRSRAYCRRVCSESARLGAAHFRGTCADEVVRFMRCCSALSRRKREETAGT